MVDQLRGKNQEHSPFHGGNPDEFPLLPEYLLKTLDLVGECDDLIADDLDHPH